MSDDQRGGRMRGQLSADDPSGIGTTIVGGQPPGATRQPVRGVPVGIEKVLYTAAIDPGFREALLRDRESAARARGFELEGSELAMLRLAPEAQLASAIAALDTSEASLARRGFMRAVAGAVTLAAGSILVGCGDDAQPAGIRPNELGLPDRTVAADGVRPNDMSSFLEGPMPAGIRPNELGPDQPHHFDSGGIRPDEAGAPDAKKSDGK